MSQYAAVPQGGLISLIATAPTGGNGYLYETYPDGHTIKNYYYFFPCSQVGLNADAIGQHNLYFSIDDQMSNSIIIDVTGSSAQSTEQSDNQQLSYQPSSYLQLNYQQPNYNPPGYQQPNGQQGSYQQQLGSQAKEISEEDYSFLETSMVKMDSDGRLTFNGILGTDYDLEPSNTNIITRGISYDSISYILVANPNSASGTVTVYPGTSNWNMQSAQVKYGNLMIAKAKNLLQITVPAHTSGLIIVAPQKKRYSFSVGPKPAYSFSVGEKPSYSFRAGF